MPTQTFVSQFYVKVNGTDAPQAFMDSLKQIRVDASLHMPAMATIELYDPELKWVDETLLAIGADIEIGSRGSGAAAVTTTIFAGVIAAHEPEFVPEQQYCVMAVRAYDRLHFLHRGTVSKTFTQMADSGIVSAVLREHGLQAQVTATTEQHEHFYRGDLSSYDLLQFLARRNGFVVVADDRTVHFKAPDDLGRPTIIAEYGAALKEFRPALTTAGQVNQLSVEGWNPGTKRVVTGSVSAPTFAPTATGSKRGPALAQAATSATAKLHLADAVGTQGAAQALAKSMLNRMVAGDLVAEGRMNGESKLAAGGKLTVQKVGTRFSGTYLVSRVAHVFTTEEGYYTDFWLGGMSSGTVGTLLSGNDVRASGGETLRNGLMVGIVTDNKDDKSWGRVKVKFPTLSDQETSWWAPVISAGAGSGRGLFVMPEINDEVVVAFAHGDLNQPFVLGGVWNGSDAPPSKQGSAVTSSGVEIREFKSRVGHILRFTDTSGSEKIELIDKTNGNQLVISASDNSVTIDCKGPMIINAGQDVKINAGANANIEATANVVVKGVSVSVEGSAKLSLKAPSIEIAGSAMVKISGGLVNIN